MQSILAKRECYDKGMSKKELDEEIAENRLSQLIQICWQKTVA
jgi:hypothetical protein